MNTKSSLVGELRDREYRSQYVASQISVGLPFQIRALRKARAWTQKKLAEAAGMAQPRITEIERPGGRKLNIDTLLRLSEAFDVALEVRFVPFGQFIDWNEDFDPNHYDVPTFETELARAESDEQTRASAQDAIRNISRPHVSDSALIIYPAYRQRSDVPKQAALFKPELSIVGGYEALKFNQQHADVATGAQTQQTAA